MSASAQLQGFQYFAFKFRSYVLSLSDLLYQMLPDAKILFMYRNALTWAYSFSRAFGAPAGTNLTKQLEQSGFRYMIPGVDEYLKSHSQINWLRYVAYMWVSTMQDGRWLKEQGAPLASASFEELKAAPTETIQMLLTGIGLPMPDSGQLAQVLARDSQDGTAGAQSKQKPARHLTPKDLAELQQVIKEIDPGLTPDAKLR
jgi:hypothetical protein